MFAPLGFPTPFVTAETPEVFRGMTPALTVDRALRELAAVPAERLLTVWQKTPEVIRQALGWFADHQEELRSRPDLVTRLRALPIWPAGPGLHRLEQLVMPGGFVDELHLAQVLDNQLVQRYGNFLRDVVKATELTLVEYATRQVPNASPGARPTNDVLRKLVKLLAEELGKLRDVADARKALRACPLVECTDDVFRLSSEVYFPEADAAAVLGRTVFVALIPAPAPRFREPPPRLAGGGACRA